VISTLLPGANAPIPSRSPREQLFDDRLSDLTWQVPRKIPLTIDRRPDSSVVKRPLRATDLVPSGRVADRHRQCRAKYAHTGEQQNKRRIDRSKPSAVIQTSAHLRTHSARIPCARADAPARDNFRPIARLHQVPFGVKRRHLYLLHLVAFFLARQGRLLPHAVI
jgi:hypothetical protein